MQPFLQEIEESVVINYLSPFTSVLITMLNDHASFFIRPIVYPKIAFFFVFFLLTALEFLRLSWELDNINNFLFLTS